MKHAVPDHSLSRLRNEGFQKHAREYDSTQQDIGYYNWLLSPYFIPLPNCITVIVDSMQWYLSFNDHLGGSVDLGLVGPIKIYVTFGPNQCTPQISNYWEEEKATLKRMDFF